MTSWSQLIPPESANLSCSDLIHPWNPSCWGNILDMIRLTWVGSVIFFTVHFLFQFLLKLVKDRKATLKEYNRSEFFKQLMMSYYRGVILFSTPLSAGCVACICLFRKILGRFYSKTSLFIPAAIGALGVFGLEPKFRLLYSTFFTNFALSIVTKRIELEGICKISLLQKTTAFMALSALISGVLKKLEYQGNVKLYYWFFNPIPPKPFSKDLPCCHDRSCRTHIFNSSVKYFTTGTFLSILKVLFKSGHLIFKNPRPMFEVNAWRLPAFLGLYSLIFQSIRCSIRRRSCKSSVLHNIIAGGVAGCAFPIHPSMTLLNTAVITLAQVLFRLDSKNDWFPKLPYTELLFALSTGFLFETAVLTPKICPKMALYIFRTATSGRITDHHRNILGKYNSLQVYSDIPLSFQ